MPAATSAGKRPGHGPLVVALLWLLLLGVRCGAEAAQGLLVMGALALPGFLLWGWVNPLTAPVAMAQRAGLGMALSLLTVLVVGLLGGRLLPLPSLVMAGAASLLARRLAAASPAPRSEPERPEAGHAWLAGVLVTFAIVGALSGAGLEQAGTVGFRPFFNADLIKHLAISQRLAAGAIPPLDPFGMTEGVLHYYWLQHLMPAIGLQWFPGSDPVGLVLAIGLGQTLLLVLLLFGLARRLAPRPGAALIALLLGMAGLSLDGLAAWVGNGERNWFEVAAGVNLEGLDLTTLLGGAYHVSATTLFRLCLYLPQHQLCAVFYLCWLLLTFDARGQGVLPDGTRAFSQGVLLAGLPLSSLILGLPALASVVLAWGLTWRVSRLTLVWQGLGAAAGLGLIFASGMADPGYLQRLTRVANYSVELQATQADVVPLALRLAAMPMQWLTSFGPLLLAALFGRQAMGQRTPLRACLWATVALVMLGYGLSEAGLPLGHLRVDSELKLSLLLGLVLVPLAAPWFASHSWPRWQRGLWGVLLACALPTLAHDLFWHSRLAAEDAQTTVIPAEDVAALRWIRTQLPLDVVVQQWPEPPYLAGGRDTWVPALAGRGIAVSPRGGAVTVEALALVRALYAPGTGPVAAPAASLGIGYLYLSPALNPETYRQIEARWRADAGLRRVYGAGRVSVWQVVGPGVF